MPHNGIMTMIRKAIIKRMNELNLNPNKLSVMLKGRIPRRTIYDFLSGKTDARTEVASALMKALELEMKPKKKKARRNYGKHNQAKI
jgi:predicted transcriptional regulator